MKRVSLVVLYVVAAFVITLCAGLSLDAFAVSPPSFVPFKGRLAVAPAAPCVNGTMYYNTVNPSSTALQCCVATAWQACAPATGVTGSGAVSQIAYWAGASALTAAASLVTYVDSTTAMLRANTVTNQGYGAVVAGGTDPGEFLMMGNYGSGIAGNNSVGIAYGGMRFIRSRSGPSTTTPLFIHTETQAGTNFGAPIIFGWFSGAPSGGIMLTLTPTGNLATFTGKVTADTMAVTGQTKGICSLNGASPSTCTATVPSGCLPICGRVSAQRVAPGCSVTSTTLTATGANGETDVINFWCPQ